MRWIVEEADGLAAEGILSPESATALRRYYEGQLAHEETGGRTVLLAVLGAALIGAGVLLLIAHNWDNLGRPARTVLSLLPLLVGLGLSLWAVLRRPGSVAWREAAGVAHCAGVAASIALVSQTYHIAGNLSDFLFAWLLLILPLPYLLGAVLPALVYLAGIAAWAGSFSDLFGRSGAPGYWLFLAGILPYYALVAGKDRLGKGTAWLSAFLGVSMIFGLAFSDMRGLWIPSFSGLFGLFYVFGALTFPERRYHPLRVLGALGVAVLTVWFSFKEPWAHFAVSRSAHPWAVDVLAIGFPCAAAALLARGWMRGADFNRFVAVFPVVASLVYLVVANTWGAYESRTVCAIIFSLYGFALALGTAFRGIRQRAVPTLNGGLLLLAALVIARFADSSFGIVERGIAFVVLGGLMLAANLWLVKSKREDRA